MPHNLYAVNLITNRGSDAAGAVQFQSMGLS